LGTAPGTLDQTAVTAAVAGQPSQSQTNYTSVPQVFGVNIAPNRNGQVTPGNFIDYTHYITNTGNGTDSFTLSASHTASGVTIGFPDGQQCLNLAKNAGCVRHVRVSVAAGSTDLVDTTTVTATSQLHPATFDKVIDVTQIAQVAIPQISAGTTKNAQPPTTVL